jgi:hypothetical protein
MPFGLDPIGSIGVEPVVVVAVVEHLPFIRGIHHP